LWKTIIVTITCEMFFFYNSCSYPGNLKKFVLDYHYRIMYKFTVREASTKNKIKTNLPGRVMIKLDMRGIAVLSRLTKIIR